VLDAHDMPLIAAEPGGVATATSDHEAPFHRTAINLAVLPGGDGDSSPKARQRVLVAHEMESSAAVEAPAGIGLATIDHRLPFHRSSSGRDCTKPRAAPTAQQLLLVVQETADRSTDTARAGLGFDATDHFDPSHWRISALLMGESVTYSPTAMQCRLDVHDTPFSKFPSPSPAELGVGTFGLDTTDHRLPFQCSTSVRPMATESPGAGTRYWPTATQNVLLVHDTEVSELVRAPAAVAFGLGTIDQADPSHRSIKVLPPW